MTSWPGTRARIRQDIPPPASDPLMVYSSPEPRHALRAAPGLLLAGWGRVRGRIDAELCQRYAGLLQELGSPS